MEYLLHILIIICLSMILAMSQNLLMGYTGLFNVGHAAFFGIGAYTSAILVKSFNMHFLIALFIAGIVSSFFGMLLGYPALKLRGDYFAIATLGFAEIIQGIFKNWNYVTNGTLGIPGVPRPTIFGYLFLDNVSFLFLIMGITIITYTILDRLVHSPFGRVLRAIRDDEIAAQSLGKHTTKYKTTALMIAAFFAGIAGSVFAHYVTFVNPRSFVLTETLIIMSTVVLGGLGSMNGSLLGAIILIILPEPLRFIGLPSALTGIVRQMLFGLILIMLMLKKPEGFIGEKLQKVKNDFRC